MSLLRLLFLTLFAGLSAWGAAAADESGMQRIIASLSQNAVGITADFSGSEIFVYGAIERDRLPDERDDAIDIIVTLTGPDERVTVRRKERVAGIWVNTESVEIDRAPSFYVVATTGPLEEILSQTSDLRHRISIERAVRLVGEAQNVADQAAFSEAIIRIRRESGVYFEQIGGVKLISRTLFQTSIDLPASITEGDYEAKVYLVRDRKVLDEFATAVTVRKVGLERWIYNLAYEQSFLYGVLSLLVALLAGWGASEVFRLMRR